jgi:hypothetical protein
MEHQEFGLSGGSMAAKSTRRPVCVGGCAAGVRRHGVGPAAAVERGGTGG